MDNKSPKWENERSFATTRPVTEVNPKGSTRSRFGTCEKVIRLRDMVVTQNEKTIFSKTTTKFNFLEQGIKVLSIPEIKKKRKNYEQQIVEEQFLARNNVNDNKIVRIGGYTEVTNCQSIYLFKFITEGHWEWRLLPHANPFAQQFNEQIAPQLAKEILCNMKKAGIYDEFKSRGGVQVSIDSPLAKKRKDESLHRDSVNISFIHPDVLRFVYNGQSIFTQIVYMEGGISTHVQLVGSEDVKIDVCVPVNKNESFVIEQNARHQTPVFRVDADFSHLITDDRSLARLQYSPLIVEVEEIDEVGGIVEESELDNCRQHETNTLDEFLRFGYLNALGGRKTRKVAKRKTRKIAKRKTRKVAKRKSKKSKSRK